MKERDVTQNRTVLALALLFFVFVGYVALAQQGHPKAKVMVINIDTMNLMLGLDDALSSYVKRSVEKAKEDKVSLVVVKLKTQGGPVDITMDISDSLDKLGAIPCAAYVDDIAWSAGSIIAVSCQRIYMQEGSSIGSAAPVGMGPSGEMEMLPEKYVSAIRAYIESKAEKNGHNPQLAMAMVDKDIELYQVTYDNTTEIVNADEYQDLLHKQDILKQITIKDKRLIIAKDKLLNLTANNAKQLGFSQATVGSLDDVIALEGFNNYEVLRPELTVYENLARFLNNPIIAGLLLVGGIIAIVIEIKVPGFGLPGIIGIVCIGLLLLGKFIIGLADFFDIILIGVGIVLLLIEIFVIPGFGFTGIAGIVCILTGIVMAFMKPGLPSAPWDVERIYSTLSMIVIYFIVGIAAAILVASALSHYLPRSRILAGLVQVSSEEVDKGFVSADLMLKELLGKKGKALSMLRPAGKAIIDNKIYDVVAVGEYIPKDAAIEVTDISGNRIVVKKGPVEVKPDTEHDTLS